MHKNNKKIISIFTILLMSVYTMTGCKSNISEDNQDLKESNNESISNIKKDESDKKGDGLVKQKKVDTSYITNKYLDLSYGDLSEKQKLDIYLPENINETGSVPVIIYVHGGAFKMGDKTGGILGSVLTGLEKGYAVVSVNYRLSDEANFPAPIQDVKMAIRYLRENAKKYNLDTEKFAIWGESAGGNISAMIGTTGDNAYFDENKNYNESCEVQAVIDWFGPLQFTEMDNQMKNLGLTPKMGITNSPDSPESLYIGADISKNKELSEKANPSNYITENAPSFFIQHGTNDTNVAITQSENFAKDLEKVIGSEKVIFEALEGAGHGDFGEVKAFETKENIEKVFQFLDNTLKNY